MMCCLTLKWEAKSDQVRDADAVNEGCPLTAIAAGACAASLGEKSARTVEAARSVCVVAANAMKVPPSWLELTGELTALPDESVQTTLAETLFIPRRRSWNDGSGRIDCARFVVFAVGDQDQHLEVVR